MLTVRLVAVCLALLALSPAAEAAKPARAKGPTGLHAFLLRADEPRTDSFPRTPAFAWNPVPGAVRYQFQLSTSSAFRENAIVYSASGLTSPVVAPSLTLPWITGQASGKHALYARVRAVTRGSITPWSAGYGLDIEPFETPKPLPSSPGVLRWSPVEGAGGYQVWLVDADKFEVVYTNVLDEREFYTFHRAANWTGTVRWRIRALRNDVNFDKRQNSIPAVGYGPWSPVYSSSNPAYKGGPIKLLGTLSDVASNGGSSSPAHELMPAFLFEGDQALDGTSAELFRIYAFTDRQCLNRVYTGAVTGAPAYAPRPYGPLALPTSPDGLATARARYLADGSEGASFTFDGETLTTTESAPAAKPTSAVPSDSDSDPSGSAASAPAGPEELKISGDPGAPVDLWDNDWPEGGYYWTAIAVEAVSTGAFSTILDLPLPAGATTISVLNADGFVVGDILVIGTGTTQEIGTITAISGSTITVGTGLAKSHTFGEVVARGGGGLQYRDLELAQDVCAAGRVMAFGKTSEVALTSGGELFASGLSTKGRLTSGFRTKSFYGHPLVSWTPAFAAYAYQVQWSKTRYPFRPVANPKNANARGTMTWGTSILLPVAPGTWYYRVRGFDFSLPTGAQQMSWSDPARIVVAKPKFKLVGKK
jgi:hypothetical protein